MTYFARSFAGLFTATVLAFSSFATAGDENWLTDMDHAMEVAKAEGKEILVDFTGSDWCGWCIKLNDEVFSKSVFKTEAPEKFVLVELDFPTEKIAQTAEVKAHNAKWRDKFGIRGYPTIVLVDSYGTEFARTGYRDGGPAPYMEHLTELLNGKKIRDAALEAASGLKGIARAKMLDWALSIEEVAVEGRDDLMNEIIELDADNIAGLRETYQQKLIDRKVEEALGEAQQLMMQGQADKAREMMDETVKQYDLSLEKKVEVEQFYIVSHFMAGEFEQGLARVDTALAMEGLDSEQKQQLAIMRIQAHMQQGNPDEAIAAFDAAHALDPDSETGQMLADEREGFIKMVQSEDR